MKIIFIILIILIIYYYYFCDDNNIEGFKNNDDYLKELQNILTNNEYDNMTINNDLSIDGKLYIKNIKNNLQINGNLTVNQKTKGKLIYLDRMILNNNMIFYTKQNALIIGKIDNNKIAPAIVLSPGSKEGLWIIHTINTQNFGYYWYNNGQSGRSNRTLNDFNDDILKDVKLREFKYIDNL